MKCLEDILNYLKNFIFPPNKRKQHTKNKQNSLISQDFDNPNGFLHYKDNIIDKYGDTGIQMNISLNESFTDSLKRRCEECYDTYEMMLDAGVAREMARMVLPINICLNLLLLGYGKIYFIL